MQTEEEAPKDINTMPSEDQKENEKSSSGNNDSFYKGMVEDYKAVFNNPIPLPLSRLQRFGRGLLISLGIIAAIFALTVGIYLVFSALAVTAATAVMTGIAVAVVKALALPAIATALSTASPIAAAFIIGGIATAATAAVTLFFNAVHGIGLGVGALRGAKMQPSLDSNNGKIDCSTSKTPDPSNSKIDCSTGNTSVPTSGSPYQKPVFYPFVYSIYAQANPTAEYFTNIFKKDPNNSNYPVWIRIDGDGGENKIFTLDKKKNEPVVLFENLSKDERRECKQLFPKWVNYVRTGVDISKFEHINSRLKNTNSISPEPEQEKKINPNRNVGDESTFTNHY